MMQPVLLLLSVVRASFFLGSGGAIALSIWSIVDAVRVAKVKNLAFRANNKTSLNFQIDPFLMNTPTLMSNTNISAGLSLKLNF